MIDLESAGLVRRVVPPTPQYCWPLLSRRIGDKLFTLFSGFYRGRGAL
jgi:hypothetical protein